jgi:aspartate/methionine/tyrosine aminotransferase
MVQAPFLARSDEVYALSVYKPQGGKFVSAMTVAQQLVQAEAADAGAASDGQAAAATAADGSLAAYSQAAVDTYVHLLWGMSKDFCASGLRVGVLYSRSTQLQKVGGRLVGCVGLVLRMAAGLVRVCLPALLDGGCKLLILAACAHLRPSFASST